MMYTVARPRRVVDVRHRLFLCACFMFLLTFLFSPSVHAYGTDVTADVAGENAPAESEALTLPDSYLTLVDSLPDDLIALLPDGLTSDAPEVVVTAVGQMTSLPTLLKTLLAAVGVRLGEGVHLFGLLTGLLLVAAVFRSLKDIVGGTGGQIFSFCVRLCLYAAIAGLTVGMLDTATCFLDHLITFSSALLPLVGTMTALSGRLSQATVSQGMLAAHLSILQYVSASVTPPVCGACLALSLTDGLGHLHTQTLSGWIKKTYASFLGLVTFLMSLALGTQTVLASRADTLRMKGVKYAVGSMLPLVGGAVAGSLGTVAAGIDALRSVCGVSGLLLLSLLFLPTLLELLLMRSVIRLAVVIGGLLGCDGEARLLEEIASLYGYLAATVCLCSMLTLLILAITFVTASAG